MKKKKVIFNWSGGKDSALALLKIFQQPDFEIAGLLTTVSGLENKSSMHNIPEKILRAQAGSIGLPLHIVRLPEWCAAETYGRIMSETTRRLLKAGIDHFAFGDIFLRDVRSYREKQLEPMGIKVLEPLWDMEPDAVMDSFIASGLKTVVVTTMADKLGAEYIGREIDRRFIAELPADVDPCGENGEYHTLCFDGPIFSRPVEFEMGEPYSYTATVKSDDGTERILTYHSARIFAG